MTICQAANKTQNYQKRQSRLGFTMIETLVALAVLGLFFTAVAMILQRVLENVGVSRVKTTALALAGEKMEIIRNMSYADVGTQNGIPQGLLAPSEEVIINSLPFTVTTSITYVDDPYDDIAPNDLINTDYKRARVEITWGGTYASIKPLALVTNIIPKGKESDVGGGTLKIQVFNAHSQPVSNAIVNIDNATVSPEIHIQTLTDASGIVSLPGTPACEVCYEISVSKTGYSTDRTYSTLEVANPLQPLSTVISGEVTQIAFAIDQLSSLTVNSYNLNYQAVANVTSTLRGNKIIGYDIDDYPVNKYERVINTGGYTVTIPLLEWDNYTLDFSNSAHTLAGSNPIIPFALFPNTNLTVPIIAVTKYNASLLVIIKDPGGQLLASASAALSNQSLSYETTKFTPSTGSANFGQSFFANLTPETYDLIVSLPGYEEATASVIIDTNQQKTFTLNYFQP